MGLVFEGVPAGYEHRRCVPLVKKDGKYTLKTSSLIKHNDYKYAPELRRKGVKVMDYKDMFVLQWNFREVQST